MQKKKKKRQDRRYSIQKSLENFYEKIQLIS